MINKGIKRLYSCIQSTQKTIRDWWGKTKNCGSNILRLTRKLFLGNEANEKDPNPVSTLKDVWNDKTKNSVGLYRIVELVIVFLGFFNYSFWLHKVVKKHTKIDKWQNVASDFFVIIPFVITIYIVSYRNFDLYLLILLIYLMFACIQYLFKVVFIDAIYSTPPISFPRSVLLLGINYVQIKLGFLYIYKSLGLVKGINGAIQALYFILSSERSIKPVNNAGKLTIICEGIVFFVFISIFIAYFINGFNSKIVDGDEKRGGE